MSFTKIVKKATKQEQQQEENASKEIEEKSDINVSVKKSAKGLTVDIKIHSVISKDNVNIAEFKNISTDLSNIRNLLSKLPTT